MLGILIALLIIFSTCIFAITYFDKKIEEVLLVSILLVVFELYIFGLLNILKYGCYFLLIKAIIYYIISIYKIIKERKIVDTFKKVFTPAFVIWCLFLIFILYINVGRMFYNWDEFTQWGSSVYDMYYTNALSIYNKPSIMLSRYPQAMTILEYFFQFFNAGGFREWICYVAYQILYISLFIPFLKKVKWNKKSIPLIITFPIVMFGTGAIFYSLYISIYVDAILGILFGYLVAYIFLNDKYDFEFYLNLFLGLFMLILTKDTGLVFACIFLMIFTFEVLSTSGIFKSLKKKEFKNVFKKIKPILLTMLFMIVIYLSWQLAITFFTNTKNAINGINSQNCNLKDFIKLLFGNGSGFLKDVYAQYIKTNFVLKILGNRTIFGFVIMICILYFLCFITQGLKVRKKAIIETIGFFLGIAIYSLFLLYCYCTVFPKREALELSSYNRYLFTYLSGWILVIFLRLVNDYLDSGSDFSEKILNLSKYLIIFIVIIIAHKPYGTFKSLMLRENLNEGIEYRYDFFKDYVNNVKRVIKDDNNSVFIISQKSNGLDYWILRYELRDTYNDINKNIYGITTSEYEKEYQFVNVIEYEDFKKDIFKNYDYVVLFAADDIFIKEYSKMFEKPKAINSHQLYKVNKSKKKLELVEFN